MLIARRTSRATHRICAAAVAAACASLTAGGLARAEESHSRTGLTLRGGSVAGFTQLSGQEVPTVGVQVGLGYQLGPLAAELEHERSLLLEEHNGQSRGDVRRSAVNLRLYVLGVHRFRSRSILRAYLEAGAGRTTGSFSSGDRFSRLDTAAGGGVLLDHRALSSRGGLRFAGWYLGWSFRASPSAPMSPSWAAACKASAGEPCPAPPEPESPVDVGLMVGSAATFSW